MRAQGQIPGLNGLRAMSIGMLLAGHAWSTLQTDNPVVHLLLSFLGISSTGVLMFFVISGYLITTLLRRELEDTGSIDLRGFYLRRILRIFPAFFAYIAVVAVLSATGVIGTRMQDIATAATFTLNYAHLWASGSGSSDFWFVGHLWTLALEEQFYLLWPLTLLGAGVFGAKRVAICIIVASPLVRIVTYVLWPEVRGQIGVMLHTAVDPMMVGSLVALGERHVRFERFVRPFISGRVVLVVTAFVIVLSPILTRRFGGTYALPIGMTASAIGVALIMVYATRDPVPWLSRFLNHPAVVYVGLLSYSLYLWQQLFLTKLNTTVSGAFPLNLVACFGVAMISYHCLEMPFLRLKNRLGRRPPAVARAEGVT